MLQGAGGNIGASIGEDGIVVIDDQYAPLADKIQNALKGITDNPVRFIINTHYHEDHTGEVFRRLRQRGCFPRNALQFIERAEEREVHTA